MNEREDNLEKVERRETGEGERGDRKEKMRGEIINKER